MNQDDLIRVLVAFLGLALLTAFVCWQGWQSCSQGLQVFPVLESEWELLE